MDDTSWASAGSAPCQCDDDPDQLLDALAFASSWLDALTGGRAHPAQCWREAYSTCAREPQSWGAQASWPAPSDGLSAALGLASTRLSRQVDLRLRKGPVVDVVAVECLPTPCPDPSTATGEPLEFCRPTRQTVRPTRGSASCGCGCGAAGLVRVEYRVGSTLPAGTERLVGWLACEVLKGWQGSACSLPERVTSVSRQGVSWSFQDDMAYLEAGRTGIGRVDAWLAQVQRLYGRATVLDPLTQARAWSEPVWCGSGPGLAQLVAVEPQQVDLVLYAGDDLLLDVTVASPDGTPADLAGATARAQARTSASTVDFAVQVGPEPGLVHLSLPGSAVTGSLCGEWDLQVTDALGRTATIARGSVLTRQEVTA